MPTPSDKVLRYVATRSPRVLWEEYRNRVYGGSCLSKAQERECSNAFFAGILSCSKFLGSVVSDLPDEKSQALAIEHFLDLNKVTALSQNPTGKN
jgi:hypothetical protein